MRVIVKNDYDSCSKWVAKHIAQRINEFHPSETKPFVLGLPTGSTPLGTYAELIKLNKTGGVSFTNVITFNMDEYIGLDAAHPQSYHYFMFENFFNHIDIKKENIHILNGLAKDKEAECVAYEKAIADAGGIRLFFGGIGSDGHIAFNEPGESFASRTHIAFLTKETIDANSRFFDGDISKVPTHAFSVGVGTICDSDEVVIMATGRVKARAVAQGIEGTISHMWPITALQLHKNAVIVCDDEASEELKVKTLRYFADNEIRYEKAGGR
ncbi:MAG: glucosamine-6-phosphate deaminase [Treponema sp.]|nr:glucosamine-6-phosphate deaminase [Treponema sp.]